MHAACSPNQSIVEAAHANHDAPHVRPLDGVADLRQGHSSLPQRIPKRKLGATRLLSTCLRRVGSPYKTSGMFGSYSSVSATPGLASGLRHDTST